MVLKVCLKQKDDFEETWKDQTVYRMHGLILLNSILELPHTLEMCNTYLLFYSEITFKK